MRGRSLGKDMESKIDQKQYEIYQETKTHSLPEFPYNTYLCSIPMDFRRVALHWHNDMELVVIKKGEGIVGVNLVSYEVKAGDVVFILPGQLHSIKQKENAVMEYENIIFKIDMLKSVGMDICDMQYIQPLFTGNMDFPPLMNKKCEYYAAVAPLIEQIDRMCHVRPVGYQLAVKGFLFQIIFQVITNTSVHRLQAGRIRSLDKVKQVLTYIEENYARPISIDEIAKVCHYSKSHFMKFFKENMGMGFIQYLNEHRLEVASQMLLKTSDNILDIAEKTGFDNLSYFNRMFKRKYGVTPGQFRKQ